MPANSKSEQMGLFEELPKVAMKKRTAQGQPSAPCPQCAERYLSDHEVASRFGISKATVWRWHDKNPGFPGRIKLSRGTSRWKLSDLVRFEAKKQSAVVPDLLARTKT
jgi:predicted DNA-binding transcriptional regulator AlpA